MRNQKCEMRNYIMIGADILLKSLIKEGATDIFGYPGGVTLPLHNRMPDYPEIKHVLPKNEQGGAFAADAYYRVTGKPGVCLTTSGPGATNLITGIANSFMDSIGIVAITCQVATTAMGSDAFQEIDVTGVTQSITKQNYIVKNVADLPRIIKEAFHLASTGRPGPVHIDIPVDILNAHVDKFEYPKEVDLRGYNIPEEADKNCINDAIDIIKKSARPIIIAGHGAIISRSEKELENFIKKTNIPVVTTLLGLGCLPHDHKLNFGMLGMHGMKYANMAVHNADLIIGLGMRFDDRITGKLSEFAKGAKVIHIEIDDSEINKNVETDVQLVGDCTKVLKQLNDKVDNLSHKEWVLQLDKWAEEMHIDKVKKHVKAKDDDALLVADVVAEISKTADKDCIVTADVGQNQMWTAQFFESQYPGQILNSGGLGSMGYSLPAAVGAQVAEPKKQVWALMGDGGCQMNIQELGTVMTYKLPIKIMIFHNGYLGMVRQWQDLFYNKNYMATPLTNPDFVKIGEAYGIKAKRITTADEAKEAIKEVSESDESVLLEFIVGDEDNVFPMMPKDSTLDQTIIRKEDLD